jgi:hypothetical protein
MTRRSGLPPAVGRASERSSQRHSRDATRGAASSEQRGGILPAVAHPQAPDAQVQARVEEGPESDRNHHREPPTRHRARKQRRDEGYDHEQHPKEGCGLRRGWSTAPA